MDQFDFSDYLQGRQTANNYHDLDSNLSNAYGARAPVKLGLGVYHTPGTVGAGRPFDGNRSFRDVAELNSTPAYLRDYHFNDDSAWMPIWPYEMEVDFAIAGVSGQSRMKRDFYARHFVQPRFILRCQTFDQYTYNKTSRFIRRHQLKQVMMGFNPAEDALELNIKNRTGEGRPKRTTKGGYRGMGLRGYIETVAAGAQRFNFAPDLELTFILQNAEEGIFRDLDNVLYEAAVGNYMKQFGPIYLDDPNIDPPKAWETPKDEESKSDPPPEGESDKETGADPQTDTEVPAENPVVTAGRLTESLFDILFGSD